MSYRELRGDNLHNMMIDPTTVNARIYVGNIPTNEITKRDVEELFLKYGPILGVSLVRGFGFVQFEHDAHALEAIKHENGSMFRGKKIEVKPARVYGGRPRGGGTDVPGPRKLDVDDRDPFRDRSPIDDRGRERDWRDRDRFDNFSAKSGSMERGNYYGRDGGFGGKDTGLFTGQDKFRSGPNVGPGRDDRGNNFGKDPYGPSTFRPTGMGDARPSMPPRGDYGPSNNVNPLERTNDCEIIVFNKAQREYAEYIEHRLKQLDISVDLLFPNEEVPISRILANISSRGSLYAISVMPQNEEHRSLTLNILHGLPQEHRNMPLEDAVPLIKRNFEAYRTGEKAGSAAVPTAVAVAPAGLPAPTSDRHPEAIQVLLGLLADNRQLTVLQYDRVIRYLQEKRELQLKLELGDAKDLAATKEPTTKQQVDLQHRILNILNNQSTANNSSASGSASVGGGAGGGLGGSVGSSASMGGVGANPAPGLGLGGLSSSAGMYPSLNIGPVPAPVAPPSGNWQNQPTSTPLLSDPTVQKALDSLMQGNLLRKITPTTGSSTPSMSSLGTPPSQPLFGSAWGSGASKM